MQCLLIQYKRGGNLCYVCLNSTVFLKIPMISLNCRVVKNTRRSPRKKENVFQYFYPHNKTEFQIKIYEKGLFLSSDSSENLAKIFIVIQCKKVTKFDLRSNNGEAISMTAAFYFICYLFSIYIHGIEIFPPQCLLHIF